MAGPADIMAAVNRKYDIQQQEASARSALFDMQARLMPSQTASENALRAAQGYATREQGATYGPLAGAQVAGTMAGIPEMGARASYYGAMSRAAGIGQMPYGDAIGTEIMRQIRAGQPGGGSSGAPGTAPAAGGGSTVPSGPLNIPPPATASAPSYAPGAWGPMNFEEEYAPNTPRYREAKGTSRVPGKAKGKAAPAPAPTGAAPSSAGLMAALPSLMAMMGGGGGGGGGMPSPLAMGGRGGAPMPSPQGAPFAMGGAVPGQGSGKVDTVPAMLAPGEAVLNKPAAEMVGRDRIAKANAAGRAKMGGMPKPVAGGHAGGAEEITGKPGPGQTQTNGSWGGQNQGLRLQLGMGAPRPAPVPTPVPKPQGFASGTKQVKGPDFFKGYAKGASDVHTTLKMFGKGFAKPVAAGRGMV